MAECGPDKDSDCLGSESSPSKVRVEDVPDLRSTRRIGEPHESDLPNDVAAVLCLNEQHEFITWLLEWGCRVSRQLPFGFRASPSPCAKVSCDVSSRPIRQNGVDVRLPARPQHKTCGHNHSINLTIKAVRQGIGCRNARSQDRCPIPVLS